MTSRLYYDDSYTTSFTAQVVEQLELGGRPAVILDRTFFYPTGGGQPNDLGTLNGIGVVDVVTREGDAEVVHLLAAPLEAKDVTGQIDWARRFDFMQHHTGQHILTQAFVQVADLHTVSFHLSGDTVTIDLDTPALAQNAIDQAEKVANQVIYDNRAVTARLIDPNDTSGVRMRKLPPHLLTPGLRVIEVEDFDATACGGTHVRQTGEIGMIKVIRAEKRTEKTRVEFRCGWRALSDYREKNALASQLTSALSCGLGEVENSLARLQDDYKQTLRALKAANGTLIEYEAVRLRADAPTVGEARVVRAVFTDRDPGDLRALANLLVAQPSTIALLGVAGEKAQIIVARSADLPNDMRAVLERAKTVIPTLRGGGQPTFAQGGANADAAQIEAALAAAEKGLSE